MYLEVFSINNSLIKLRKVIKEDFNHCRILRIRALSDSPEAFGGTFENAIKRTKDEYRQDTYRWATSEKSTLFIALCDENPIGMVGAYIEDNSKRSYLCSLWVDPKFRKNGIGNRLCSKGISWLCERSQNLIYLWVADKNAAVMFYRKLGFMPTLETKKLPSNESIGVTLYVYNRY